MLNKLKSFMDGFAGEKIVCAVSGGADSMALLWGLYLLKDKLQLDLCVAHFNHHLRGEESNRDEAFVKSFCADYRIAFVSGSEQVIAGKKGLEASAREARYAFLRGLDGKIATAHTADDNAETVLMHLVRGTGLKGLGGIAPINGRLIRPMLNVTRTEVLEFLEAYHIPHIEDSSNAGDAFLRNRLRHHVMPLLKQENPQLSQNLSAMALRLRQDEQALNALASEKKTNQVSLLRLMQPAIRSRVLYRILLDAGLKEPEAEHISAMERLVFSQKPSARAHFSNGITMQRNYDALEIFVPTDDVQMQELTCPGVCNLPGVRIRCSKNVSTACTTTSFAFTPKGKMVVRPRKTGDALRLSGGTKSLKKLFIDEKIPTSQRNAISVLADEAGVLGVVGFGGNLDRISADGSVRIDIEYL